MIKLNFVIVAVGIEVLTSIDVMKHNQLWKRRYVFADGKTERVDKQTSDSAYFSRLPRSLCFVGRLSLAALRTDATSAAAAAAAV